MGTNLPTKLGDYTPLQAQQGFTDTEKAAYDDLLLYLNKQITDTVWWYWALGVKVAKLHKDAQKNQDTCKVTTRPQPASLVRELDLLDS